jgi:hypothetical protein
MSTTLNPPPGWPPAPSGWAPPPGWQPNPSWPDPPPGWNLWIEDTAARNRQICAARWTIAGGIAAILGALLPFLSSPLPYIYNVSPAPKETAAFLGVILIALGLIMLIKSDRAKLIAGSLTLVVAGPTSLTLGFILVGGIIGFNERVFGSSFHLSFSPHIGIFISILGCGAAEIGAAMSFCRR